MPTPLILLLLALPLLYDYGPPRFRYILKLFVYYFAFTIFAVVLLPYFLLRPRRTENMLVPAAAMRAVARLMGEQQQSF